MILEGRCLVIPVLYKKQAQDKGKWFFWVFFLDFQDGICLCNPDYCETL